jgi:transposase
LINEEEFMDIRALHRQGFTYAEIGRIVGRDWRTVKRYLTEGAQPRYQRKRVASKLDPFKPTIDQWLAKEPRLKATRIHQDLVRDYGFTGSYPIVQRYVDRARPRKPEPPSERFETAPGHQAQVDWSHEEPIRTSSGLELPLYGFHMVLGHSRDAFLGLVGSQDLVTFWACHRAAFNHFGGIPAEILYDRTKTVVRSHVGRERREGDRVYHPEALASAHHYGFQLRLCRPYRPQTKGKVESDVSYVRERLLRAHGFADYEQANRRWAEWNADIARRRVHGTHGEIVAERAERDRQALGAVPAIPYLVVARTQRKVARDGLINFEGRRYPAAGAKPGETVELRLGAKEIEIYSTESGERLGTHPRARQRLALPDPTERSVSLASVLAELPAVEVHRRSLDSYAEVARG